MFVGFLLEFLNLIAFVLADIECKCLRNCFILLWCYRILMLQQALCPVVLLTVGKREIGFS